MKDLVPLEVIERRILLIRDQKVMLDQDLAELYGVPTKRLNEQVKRNIGRFPKDFMFQLTKEEHQALRSQIATSKTGRGGRRIPPYAFTEQGVAMLSSVLNSERAVQVNIAIMRVFVRFRQMLATHEDLREKIEEMERRYGTQLKKIIEIIKQLAEKPEKPYQIKGFTREKE